MSSEVYRTGLAALDRRDFATAAPILREVALGKTDDDVAHQQKAYYDYAVVLDALGNVGEANCIFEVIGSNPCHVMQHQATWRLDQVRRRGYPVANGSQCAQ